MSVRPVDGVWPCPFRGFHCCPDGMAGSKGFPRLIAHIKRLHLSSDDWKKVLREAISTDSDLFTSVGEASKASGQWLCGACMCLHALSRGCHHEDGLTIFNRVVGDTAEFIVGISKPHTGKEVVSLGGLAVDDRLLDRIFSLPLTTVKSIPPSCRMAFSHALTAALGKVAAAPDSVEAWVRLLVLPRCTLRVFRPSNRQEHQSGNRKSLQCQNIRRSLIAWGDEDGFVELILSLLAQPSNETPRLDKPSPSSDNSATHVNIKQYGVVVGGGGRGVIVGVVLVVAVGIVVILVAAAVVFVVVINVVVAAVVIVVTVVTVVTVVFVVIVVDVVAVGAAVFVATIFVVVVDDDVVIAFDVVAVGIVGGGGAAIVVFFFFVREVNTYTWCLCIADIKGVKK
ncbi:hypothetical protein R6Q59_016222 [Mikania micrantha]